MDRAPTCPQFGYYLSIVQSPELESRSRGRDSRYHLKSESARQTCHSEEAADKSGRAVGIIILFGILVRSSLLFFAIEA